MSLFAGYYSGQLDDGAIEGNLCRCTGYLPIRRAAQRVTVEQRDRDRSQHPPDDFVQHLETATAQLEASAYKGHGQYIYRPTDLPTVLSLLHDYPNATLTAGATDLGLEMSWHRQSYPVLIALEGVTELLQLTQTDTSVTIGAAVPLSHIEDQLRGVFPSLDEMLHWFAARQVRNRATVGGNLGTASPIGDLPPVLLALDATVQLVSATGERTLPLPDFFKGYRLTDLQPGEVIRSVTIPKTLTPRSVQRLSQSYKVGKRGTDDISIVAASYTVDLDDQNQICHVRLAYGGVAATPVRAIATENWLIGQSWTHTTILAAKEQLQTAFTPLSDLRGSADYRRQLVANLFEKFFVEFDGSSREGTAL